MKKIILVGLILCCFIFAVEDVEDGKNSFAIDTFEDGNITDAPQWWTFGDSKQDVVNTSIYSNSPLIKYLGSKSLQIKGNTDNWYIGGMGAYLGLDADKYTHLKIYVYGNGPKSGKVTIQLYDDDNFNYVLEQDVENNYEPIFDDKFEYTVNVTWTGWKILILPIDKFKDVNKTVGDNMWNPDGKKGSGGLLHYQMIFLASSKTGPIDVAVDNIKLITIAN